ncbi:MAG: asparaginase [Candidatus Limnocylindrales bacterium]
MSRVAVVFTGGTISMEPDPDAGGLRPILDGAAILARAPEAAQLADLDAIDWGLVPASHLRFEQIIDIARVVSAALARPEIDGAVVVQGTDTLEETAFAFDLLVGGGKPVVVTGAMRDSTSPEYDGPANLRDAVACASNSLYADCVRVVMGGRVIPAEQALKSHATDLDAFRVREGSHPLGPRKRLAGLPAAAVEDVHLVTAVVGMDGSILRGVAATQPRGVVVAATGSGNTSLDLLDAARELMAAGTIVCLSTRTPGGSVDAVYAFPGGGATWKQAGALISRLDGPKTRVALALALAAGYTRDQIAELIA